MKFKSNMNLKKKILLLISCILLIVIIVFAVIFIRRYTITNKYSFYEQKMNIYDYSKLYDNQKSTSYEKVTKLEALKFVIASSLNTTDIKKLIIAENYDNETELWLQCAYKKNIVSESEVNAENYTENVTYMEFITYLYNAKVNILKIEDKEDINVLAKDYEKYDESQKKAIESLIESNVLENNDQRISGNKQLIKGVVSKTIYEYVNKLNTITVNRNEDKIVTEESKLPSNADQYPYILESVDKEVYEQEFTVNHLEDFVNPADYYKIKKDGYYGFKDKCEDYYNYILNVDYNTITLEDFRNSTKDIIINPTFNKQLQDYIDYIKENKIILKGKATAQMPIIYNDGSNYRARVKLEFEIVSSDTKYNILYYDNVSRQKIKYDDTKYTLYIDAKLGSAVNSSGAYVDQELVYNLLLPMSKQYLKLEAGE